MMRKGERTGAERLQVTCARRMAATCVVAFVCVAPTFAQADCYDEAAQHHQVNPWILRAIAAQESSFNPNAKHPKNADRSTDYGLTGLNSVHLRELARYGVTAADMMDSCKSVYLAGWHLSNMVKRFGNTWEAVGAYHSKTPSRRDSYAGKIRRIVDFWIETGVITR